MTSPNRLHITISKVDGILFNGEATSVTVPTVDGEITVLAHHEALIALLKKGIIKVTGAENIESLHIEITGGLFEMSNNKATILV